MTTCLLQHFTSLSGNSSWAWSLATSPVFLSTSHCTVEGEFAYLPNKRFSFLGLDLHIIGDSGIMHIPQSFPFKYSTASYSYNVKKVKVWMLDILCTLIGLVWSTCFDPINSLLDILGLDILSVDILTIRHFGIRHSGMFPLLAQIVEVEDWVSPSTIYMLIGSRQQNVIIGLVRSIAPPGHVALGILRYPSQTGEFDCLRLHPRPWSAWHLSMLIGSRQQNLIIGWVRLPLIAPKGMKRLHGILRYPSQKGWVWLQLHPRPWSCSHRATPMLLILLDVSMKVPRVKKYSVWFKYHAPEYDSERYLQ